MTEQLPGAQKSKNFLHFSRFPFFSSRPNTIDFIDNTYHAWKLLFSKNYMSESLYCKRQHLKFNARMKKINILQFAKRTKITFSSIEPLLTTRWLLIYWSPEALWDRSGKKLWGHKFTASPHNEFFTLYHC